MSTNDFDESAASPPISVCIPMYNNSATIERCLRSVLEQDGVDFEIVVVDDDSPDGCAAVAEAMLRPGDRLIRNETRLGLMGNHNKCLEVARGHCIQFVHGDDWLLPGALRTLAPVSYTHLDVYKRQHQNHPKIAGQRASLDPFARMCCPGPRDRPPNDQTCGRRHHSGRSLGADRTRRRPRWSVDPLSLIAGAVFVQTAHHHGKPRLSRISLR